MKRGDPVIAKLTPLGASGAGVVASEPYDVPHFAGRKLVRMRLEGRAVEFDDVPKGQWVSVRFFEAGYHEVPVAWVKLVTKAPEPARTNEPELKPEPKPAKSPKNPKKPRVKRK